MAAGYTKIEINGAEVAPDDDNRLIVVRHSESLDGDSLLELAEGPGVRISPTYPPGSEVALTYDAGGPGEVVAFRGKITRAAPMRTPQGWLIAYTCEGRPYDLERLPCFNPTSNTLEYRFNMSTLDREYSASLTGMTVGQICKRVLGDQAAALAARGIGIDFLDDFDQLDWVPSQPVQLGGSRLLSSLRGWLATMAPNHRIVAEPTASGAQVRLAKLSGGFAVKDVALGQEAVEFSPGEYAIADCASRVRIVGSAEIEGFELDTESGKLLEDWTPEEEDEWSISDFEETKEAVDEGDVVSMTSTAVTLRSDDAAREWDANFWAGTRRGRLRLEYEAIEGDGYELVSQQTRDVASNDALTSGGTSTLIVDRPYNMNTFTRYKIYGLKEDAERPQVFRRYKPALTEVRDHIAHWFAKNEPFETNGGVTTVWTMAPRGGIEVNGIFYEIPMEVDSGNGTIYFTDPVVALPVVGNSRTDLETPGSTLTVPNVKVFLPIAVRPMEVQCPADADLGPYDAPVGTPTYAGTAYDWHGLQETWTEELPDWQDRGALEQIKKLACELHDSVKDVRMSAGLTFYGFRAHEFFPLRNRAVRLSAVQAPGSAVAVDLDRWGALDLPIRSVSISWGGPSGMTVAVALSNERRPLKGTDFYTHGISLQGVHNDPFAFTEGLPNTGVPLMGPVTVAGTFSPVDLAMGSLGAAQAMGAGAVNLQQSLAMQGVGIHGAIGAPIDRANQAFMLDAGAQIGAGLNRFVKGQTWDTRIADDPVGLDTTLGWTDAMDERAALRAEEERMWREEIERRKKEGEGTKDLEGWVDKHYAAPPPIYTTPSGGTYVGTGPNGEQLYGINPEKPGAEKGGVPKRDFMKRLFGGYLFGSEKEFDRLARRSYRP